MEEAPVSELAYAVTSSQECVTIMAVDGCRSAGVIDASMLPYDNGSWFLNRLIVKNSRRGQGVGSGLLSKLVSELTSRHEEHPHWTPCKTLIVTPGGYGSNVTRLIKFYQKQGFTMSKEGDYMQREIR